MSTDESHDSALPHTADVRVSAPHLSQLSDDQLPYPRERYPYNSSARFNLQHAHLFASDLDASIDFWCTWFDATVVWDNAFAGSRNVFMKVGIGALHFYDQQPRDLGKNAIHHLGVEVVGLEDLYRRMQDAGLDVGKPIRHTNGSSYFMFMAPDNVLLELFEPGNGRDPVVRDYYGMPECQRRVKTEQMSTAEN